MKTKYLIIPLAIFCFLFPSELIAQNYTPPSRELVERLLNELENCKNIQKEAQKDLETLEANASSYTLADYMQVKNLINRAQSCINSRRTELDELRKDYPGWFNNPGVAITIGVHGMRSITPRQLQNKFDAIAAKINAALARFEKLPRPEN